MAFHKNSLTTSFDEIMTLSLFEFYALFTERAPVNTTAAADVAEYEDDFEESEKSSVATASDDGDCISLR